MGGEMIDGMKWDEMRDEMRDGMRDGDEMR
jgi:hypothetical protein